MKRSTLYNLLAYIALLLGVVFILIPLYLVVVTAFKTNAETMQNFFSLPLSLHLENFKQILSRDNFLVYCSNSFIITLASLVGCVLILPLTAYPIARRMTSSNFYKFLYFFLIIGIFIPFQVKMLPLIKWVSMLGLMNRTGLILVYLSGAICEGVFLYVAYISSLPPTLEEAALMDGASTFKTYTSVIFPLLKPMTATILIKNGLWIWNDFTLPLLILNKSPRDWTLVLFQYNFKSKFGIDYSMIFACLLISILPITILYAFLQKNIMSGLTSGAVKE